MSQENVEVVRIPLVLKTDSHRRLDERLVLRFPRAATYWVRAVLRLPPHSRLRRTLIRRAVRLGLEAANRGDFEAAFSLYHRDAEATLEPRLVSLGFDPVYRGREARIGVQRRWVAELGEFRFAPEELIDLRGGRLLVIGRQEGSGLSSGAGFDNDWALLLTISGGRIVREQIFFDRAEALEAVGLSE
jgi:ketosteroid isomerase-like protein